MTKYYQRGEPVQRVLWGCALVALATMLSPLEARAHLVLGPINGGGAVTLLPNTADQQVMVFADCVGLFVGGMNLSIQIGNGGPVLGNTDVGAPGVVGQTTTVPGLTNIDVTTGTIFSGGNLSNDVFGEADFYVLGTTSVDLAANVEALGKVATLTFDTTGLSPATTQNIPFRFNIAGSPVSETDFGGTAVCDGDHLASLSVSAVPEPSSFIILGLISLLGLAAHLGRAALRI